MRAATRFLILTGVSMLAACASQAPATSGGSQSATSTSSHAIPSGYQREVVNGSEMYCRDDTDLGSRVQRTKVCLTWEQLQAEQRSNVSFGTQRTSPVD
jgi:hypothetical protein